MEGDDIAEQNEYSSLSEAGSTVIYTRNAGVARAQPGLTRLSRLTRAFQCLSLLAPVEFVSRPAW